MDVDKSIESLDDLVKRAPYGSQLKEIVTAYMPLLAELPSLRDNPKMVQARVKAEGKGGIQDIVTATDEYVQEELKKLLINKHPDWQFWGEEGENQVDKIDASKNFLLITDPIEGTNNFLAKKDNQWGSVLALVDIKSGKPVIGIVAHPTQHKFYLGVKGAGAYVVGYNNKGDIVSFTSMSEEPEYPEFTYNNSPHFEQNLRKQVDKFFELGKVEEPVTTDTLERSRKKVTVQTEGGAINFVDPESGALEAVRYRGTIYFKTSNEMAAVFVILNELGGKVTDSNGKPWYLGIDTLIAARNPADYDFLQRIYAETLDKK